MHSCKSCSKGLAMNQNLYPQLKELGKEYTILYVEDDESIAAVMSSILTLFCPKFYRACNGQEGLEMYHSNKPDLIITDISMPIMDGISMVKAIRQIDKHIPIMINSAFGDQSYLLESIYLGVDRYTMKPIQQDEFLEALHFMLTKLEHEAQAHRYQKILLQESVNKASTHMLKSMVHVFPHAMIIATHDGRIQYLNSSAVELFRLEEYASKNYAEAIEAQFMARDGMVSSLSAISEDSLNPSRLMVRTLVAKKFFMALKRIIQSEEFGELFAYFFIDITRVEYEKQKSERFSRYLHETLRLRRDKIQTTTAFVQTQEVKKESLHVKESLTPQRYEHIRLEAMHGIEKTTASAYVKEVGNTFLEEIAEMDELEKEMEDSLMLFEEEHSLDALYTIARDIASYGRTIGMLVEFQDLSFSLNKLSGLLLNLSSPNFHQRKIHLLLDGVLHDLTNWRISLFVEQNVIDIHYLDASLLSSCLQIEAELGGEVLEEEELDLF